MSEITVTLPKNQYDEMVQRVDEYKQLYALVKNRVYFTKTVSYIEQKIYYRPIDNEDLISTLESKFIGTEKRYLDEIRTLKSLVEQKNAVIFDLNDRIKKSVVEQHPTVSASYTTTMYIPKPPKKSWWKKIWSKIF